MITSEAEVERVIVEISLFYQNPDKAKEILRRGIPLLARLHMRAGKELIDVLLRFRDVERLAYEKRLRNQIPRKLVLLELALDFSEFTPCVGGRSLDLRAYQAEMYYRGSGVFQRA